MFINAISEAMGQTLSFEESGEAVYAAMVKVKFLLVIFCNFYVFYVRTPKVNIY